MWKTRNSRLEAAEKALAELERRQRDLEQDFLVMSDKVYRWMQRSAARARVDAKDGKWNAVDPVPFGQAPGDFPPGHTRGDYPAPLDPVSKMLLLRRRRLGLGATESGGGTTPVPPPEEDDE